MRCSACGGETLEQARYCEDCGASLVGVCPACGAEIRPGKRFCADCGADVRTARDAPTPAASSTAESDRAHKPVSVVFCDIVGSTGIAERIGSEAMHSLLGRFFDVALEEVRRYGGTINTFLGDGFMALVGVPVAHEDHPRRAVLAALALRRRLDAELTEAQVRIGINTGSVVVGSLGGDAETEVTAIGDMINVAARLQALADPGTILMSEATARAVTGYVRSELIGPVEVRGRSQPVTAHRVIGLGSRRSPLEGIGSRPLGRFVGRERQLAALRDLVAEAYAGRGQVVGIVGEPGMGKSRIVIELRRALADERITVLEGRCLSYGASIPYVPIADIVRANCGITESDSAREVESKLVLGLAELGIDPTDRVPLLLAMLGMRHASATLTDLPPEVVKQRTFDTLLTMSLNGSRRRPIIFVVEDLHWIDGVSQEFFSGLVDGILGAALALVCTYRPGYQAPWMQRSYATQLSLPRLTRNESLTVVQSVLGDREIAPELAQEILDKTDGNPFFLEELSRAILEQQDAGASPAVPDTVQDVLAARVGRLPDEPRRVLQTASVLGREFPLPLLVAIWSGAGDVEPHLAELTRLEFLYERGDADEPVYVFRHALTQDVAYGSLLASRRQTLHEAAGQAYESLYAARLDEVYDRLAHHYRHTERSDKAVEYLGRFAEAAVRGHAHAEAADALRQALVHADQLPADGRDRQVCELTIRLVHSLYFCGGFGESVEVLLALASRVAALEDLEVSGRYHLWLGHTYAHLGEHEGAVRNAERAIEEATRSKDVATFGKAHYVLARESYWTGRLSEGIEHGRKAVASLERTDEWWWLGHTHGFVGYILFSTGAFEEAIASAERTKAIGRAREDPRLQSYAAWNISWYEAARGNWERAIAEGTESLRMSPDPLNSAYSMAWLGYSYREKGDHAQAISLLEPAIKLLTEFRYWRLVCWFKAWLGETFLWSGDRDRAQREAAEALRLSREAAFPWAEAVALRAVGRIAFAADDFGEAESHLAQALASLEAMGCRFDAAITRMDLAEVAVANGDPARARAQLDAARALLAELDAPVYSARAAALAEALGVAS